MEVNVLLFTECHYYFGFSRSAGTYRIATELREHGYTVQVIELFGLMNQNDIIRIVEKYVGPETLAIGFSSTNFTSSVDECYWNNSDDITFVRERIKKLYMKSNGARGDTSFPFQNEVMLDIIGKFKEKNPKIKILYGGSKAQNQQARNLDCNFIAYADVAIIDYINRLNFDRLSGIESEFIKNTKTIIFDKDNDPFDFQKSEIKWHETDYLFTDEVVPIEISRGCIFRCKFCSFPLNGKKSNDFIKHMDYLYEEFLTNYERFGITSYIFSDDTFNDSTEKLENILTVVKRLPFKLRFTTYLRLDLLHAHPRQIQLLKDLGLQFAIFGIESINDKRLRAIGKGLPFQRLKDTLKKLKEVWGDDVITFASFIFGLPYETKETVEYMHKWLSEEGLDYLHEIRSLPFFISRATDANIHKSDISLDFEKYGYSYPHVEGKHGWFNESNGLHFSDMIVLADKTDENILNDKRRRYGGFAGGMLPNVGIPFEIISKTPFCELDFETSQQFYSSRLSEYKGKLLQ